MKKKLNILFILVLGFSLVACEAVGFNKNNDKPTLKEQTSENSREEVNNSNKGVKNDSIDKIDSVYSNYKEVTIVEKLDNSILVVGENVSDLIFFSTSEAKIFLDGIPSDSGKLEAGMKVKLDFDQPILESFPAQSRSEAILASSLKANQVNDKVGFYRTIIDHILKVDEKLNSGARYLGLDIEKGPIALSKAEKEALRYFLEFKYNKEILFTSYDELEKGGKIKDLSWNDGILISVKGDQKISSNGEVTFSLKKWTSGTGAYGYRSCRASWGADGKLENISYSGDWISKK